MPIFSLDPITLSIEHGRRSYLDFGDGELILRLTDDDVADWRALGGFTEAEFRAWALEVARRRCAAVLDRFEVSG